jgi:hypothetical protein
LSAILVFPACQTNLVTITVVNDEFTNDPIQSSFENGVFGSARLSICATEFYANVHDPRTNDTITKFCLGKTLITTIKNSNSPIVSKSVIYDHGIILKNNIRCGMSFREFEDIFDVINVPKSSNINVVITNEENNTEHLIKFRKSIIHEINLYSQSVD